MNKDFNRFLAPGARMYGIILVLFSAGTYILTRQLILSAVELGFALLLMILSAVTDRTRRRRLVEYIESVTYDAEEAKNNTLINFPLPIAVYRLDTGLIVWANQQFFSICGKSGPVFDVPIQSLVEEYDGKWLSDGKKRCPNLVTADGRQYQVHGNIVRGKGESAETGYMGITYWVDVTDYEDIKSEFAGARPVVVVIMLDNYDEMIRSAPERSAAEIRNLVEDRLSAWLGEKHGLVRRYDRDHYLFVGDRRSFGEITTEKFSILDAVHEVLNPAGIHATVSIGIGYDGATFEENFNFANTGLDMALSRGGDQVVIRNRVGFSFYGGRATEIETRTKVKSRVFANALSSFIRDANTTYIMGHKMADLDTLGGAVGLCCIARKLGRRARIVMDPEHNSCGEFLDALRRNKEYADLFVTPREAMVSSNGRSQLIVVDTNRPDALEDEALLRAMNRVALIDHHRRTASYIDSAVLSFHEQNASSVCELVAELLQELVEPSDILKIEADTMLAGMVTDTKSFSIRAGERTFEAAAFLRRAGADTEVVKRMLQNDYDTTVTRYRILEKALIYREGLAIAAVEQEVPRVVAAQAADELLSIRGVDASVVLYPTEAGGVDLSARSIGELNVQILLEKLGGGGNKSVAGAQLKDITVSEALEQLHRAVDEYSF